MELGQLNKLGKNYILSRHTYAPIEFMEDLAMTQDRSDEKSQGVVDFTQAREQRLEEKRKNNKRIFFKNILGVYLLSEFNKMIPVEMIDVSEEGCAFNVPGETGEKRAVTRPEHLLRFYFTKDTYVEVIVKIQNSRPSIDKGKRHQRYGCVIDQTTQSYPVYQAFVNFLKLYSENAHKDMGDVTAFYL